MSLAKAPQAVQLRDSIAKATCSVYAIESMLYLIAGIVDTYENPDITVETCILKVKFLENCKLQKKFVSRHSAFTDIFARAIGKFCRNYVELHGPIDHDERTSTRAIFA